LAVDPAQVQSRVGNACSAGASIRAINQDGSVVCEPDSDTTYDGANFATSGQSCLPGQVVSAINSDGSVACETDRFGYSGYRILKAEETVTTASGGTSSVDAISPRCSGGDEILVGGGARVSPRGFITRSRPETGGNVNVARGWTARAEVPSTLSADGTMTLEVWAICVTF
jgi:hypothetical protein